MKKAIVFLLTLVFLLTALPAMAGQGGEWTLDSFTEGMIVKYDGPGGDVIIPEEIDGEPVRIISGWAFNGNAQITSVVIPEGVTIIEGNAFIGCDALRSISLPQSLRVIGASAFPRNEHFKELTIPAGVRYIGDMALDCGLERITFEGALPLITNRMFTYFGTAYGSQAIFVPDDLLSIYRDYFDGHELIVGSGKKAEIVSHATPENDFDFDAATGTIMAYNGDSPIVTVPSAIGGVPVTVIGDHAFERMDNLYAVELPEGITRIGKRAFAYNLTFLHVNLPGTLQIIDEEAFETTYLFAQPVFPSSLTKIGARAFKRAVNLCTWADPLPLTLPEGLCEIGDEAFCNAFVNELSLPSTLTRIGSRAFADCGISYMAFNAYDMPEIAPDAFEGSTLKNLADIDLPWDITRAQWEKARAIFEPMGFAGLTVWRNNPSSGGHCFEVSFNSDRTKGAYDKEGYLSEYTGTEPDLSVYPMINWNDGSINTIGVGAGVFKGNRVIRTFWPHHCDWFTTISAEAFADSTLEYIEMFDSITTVGARAFAGCVGLSEIVLPESLTDIASDAFAGCTGITKIDVRCDAALLTPGMFADCVNLHEISFEKGAIPDGMMENCSSLTNVTLGQGVTAIDARAFAGTGLKHFVIPSGMAVDYTAFSGVADIRLSADATDAQLAAWSEALGYPWYGGILREGEESAFVKMPFEATADERFEFDEETGTIRKYLGDDVDVVIPREIGGVTVRAIAYGAFDRCEDYTGTDVSNNKTKWVPLRSVVLPETIETVGDGLFSYCQQLETFICYAPLEAASKGMFTRCTSLDNVIFVNGVRQIDNYCFEQAGPMRTLWFGNHLDRVGIRAFTQCGMTKLTLDAVRIDSGAVTACEELTELHIGSRAEEFGEIIAQDCPKLSLVCLEMPHAEGRIPAGMLLARLSDSVTVRLPEDAAEGDVNAARYSALYGTNTTVTVVCEACTNEMPPMPDPAELLKALAEKPVFVPAPQPTARPAVSADASAYLGTWYALSITMDGMVYDIAQMGGDISITLNADGTAAMNENGEIEEGTWSLTENGIDISGMTVVMDLNGMLILDAYGDEMVLGREKPVVSGPSEADLIAYADYLGEWICTALIEGGETIDPTEYGLSMTLSVNEDGSVWLDVAGDVDQARWTGAEDGISVMGQRFVLQTDGTLKADEDGSVMVFMRASDVPAKTAPTAEPISEPTAEPAPAQGDSAERRMGVRYVCVEAEMEGGYRLPASMLGAEFSMLFKPDGTMTFVMAGAELPGLTWTQRDDAFVINYYGMEMIALLTDTGFTLNYMDAMLMFFEPEVK